ncbi:MAG: hypothetical protein GY775_19745 [Candidatus Scalindua sp.]|nr:hypothetical protein [Candidatus Scalindua sp.]
MPIVNTNFIAGRMNKSVDERLLPPGEYVDALNVRLGSTENTEIGAVENSRGNTQLTTLQYGGQNLSSGATCLGAFEDGQLETMYWFVHDESNPVAQDGVVDMIVSYNTTTNQLRYHVITLGILNFDPEYLITGVDKIENLLFFTDGKNPPRRINVTSNYPYPVGNVDGIEEEDISVILKPPGFEDLVATGEVPLPAPTFQLITLAGGQNYLEDRFISFAYRYRYTNNEYSATSLFTNPAFQPNNFRFDTKAYDNGGMKNAFNAAKIQFSTGSSRVTQVDLLYKDSNTNSIYVIERFKKEDYGWGDNQHQEYVFTNSKIYSVIGADELLRLYDNVPRKAQAQTIMGNRLIYGNYTDNFNIENINGQNIPIDFSTAHLQQETDFKTVEGPVFSQGVTYTINPSQATQVPNSLATINLAEIEDQLKTDSQIGFTMRFEHALINGTTGTACYIDNAGFKTADFNLNLTINLTQNYSSVYDFVTSSDFRDSIGTVEGVNFQPIATADQGFSLTDKFNAALVPPQITCAFTKDNSSITNATAQQGFAIVATPGSTSFTLQVLAMKYTNTTGSTVSDMYEYFRFVRFAIEFSSDTNKNSLHSNRDFETGIVYMDEYARASTVLVSEYNTIYIPPASSVNKNSIQATINNYAPTWATKYKFVVKPSKAGYETIYSNFFYTDPFSNVTHFKLDGDNQQKVKTGDRLIVKRDTGGALTSLVETTVLAVEAQGSDFLATDQSLGTSSEQLAGLYMQLKATNFSIEIAEDAVIDYGNRTRKSDSEQTCNGVWAMSYPLFTYDADAGTTSNYNIPGGSIIDVKVKWRRKGNATAPERKWEKEWQFVAGENYNDFADFWNATNIDLDADSCLSAQCTARYEPTFGTPTGSGIDPNISGSDGTYKRAGDVPCDGFATTVFRFIQATPGDANSPLWFGVRSGGTGVNGTFKKDRDLKIEVEIVVQRANSVLVFETIPADANDEIYYDASRALPLVRDTNTGYMLHQADGNTDAGDQNQTTTQPAIVTLDFMDCYTFGNGVESYKYLDRIEGRSVVMGQRALAVSDQDFKETDRFADMTYSGVYSSNSGINNLNEFNLGLANFKTLETSFGPIQLLYARETDILTLQEDRISYVLANKNLISDSTGGGAIVSVPEILGQQIARVEEYGISYNPESFANYGPYFYFTDTKRAAVIELVGNSVNDRLKVISDFGMRSWFRDQFNFQLNTQKLGGYDPYMDEYVIGTNLNNVPVPEPVLDCNVQLDFQEKQAGQSVQYEYNFQNLIGDVDIDYNITAGSVTIKVLWNGTLYNSGTVTGSGTFTFAKTAATPTNAIITITPIQTATGYVTPKCVNPVPITVVKCLINSNTDNGETIHVEYLWGDGTTISPVDSDLATLGSVDTVFSFYNSQSGIRSQGVFPYNGVDLTIRVNKVNFDTYNWSYPSDNFRYLSSNTLYLNTPANVAALLAASTIVPNGNVTTPTNDINQTIISNLSLPTNNQYLYLIYDLRTIAAQQLCYDASSADDACCVCTWSCVSFSASSQAETAVSACGSVLGNTYYHNNGSGSLPIVGSIVYTASNCEDSLTEPVQVLAPGFYKISSTQYMEIGESGLVLEVEDC